MIVDLPDPSTPAISMIGRDSEVMRRHPIEARRRAVFRRVVVTTILTVGAIAVYRSLWSPWAIAPILLAVPWGWRAWVALGHGETDDVVIGRRGAWNEVTDYVRRDRVQSAAVTANWFQRRLGLATLRIDVAQPLGKVRIVDMATHEADRLLDRLVGARSSADEGLAGDNVELGNHQSKVQRLAIVCTGHQAPKCA